MTDISATNASQFGVQKTALFQRVFLIAVLAVSTNPVSWFNPTDRSHGQSGYNSYISGNAVVGDEVLRETVLVQLDAGALTGGVYFYTLTTDAFSETKMMVIAR